SGTLFAAMGGGDKFLTEVTRATFSRYPAAILRQELEVLELFVGVLKRLRRIAEPARAALRAG
ncbi:MAG: hypothetical protein ACRDQ6_18340, partial [Pseudonocardiaceae bacterium]